MLAMKDKPAVSVENVVFLSFEIQTEWSKVGVEIDIEPHFGLGFESGKG